MCRCTFVNSGHAPGSFVFCLFVFCLFVCSGPSRELHCTLHSFDSLRFSSFACCFMMWQVAHAPSVGLRGDHRPRFDGPRGPKPVMSKAVFRLTIGNVTSKCTLRWCLQLYFKITLVPYLTILSSVPISCARYLSHPWHPTVVFPSPPNLLLEHQVYNTEPTRLFFANNSELSNTW